LGAKLARGDDVVELCITLRSRKVKTVSEVIHEVVGKINQAGMQLETAAHARGAKMLQEKDGTQLETTPRIRRVLPNLCV